MDISFVAAAKQFFGFKPGQGLKDFSEELKKLTPEDRKDLASGLKKNLEEQNPGTSYNIIL